MLGTTLARPRLVTIAALADPMTPYRLTQATHDLGHLRYRRRRQHRRQGIHHLQRALETYLQRQHRPLRPATADGLCHEIPENGKIAKMGSYLASPDYRFQGFRGKAVFGIENGS
jgi:hypothetical protein